MAPRAKKNGGEAQSPVNPSLTADHAATLIPHGDGSATEHPNVSANGTYPPRPEAK